MIAVTGSLGWIGREVCRWLEAQGQPVRRLNRSGAGPGAGRLDLADPDDRQWREVLVGCTALIHCAAHVHRPVETPAERELFHRVNVTGTERLLASCRAAGLHRFILASTVGVYDWHARNGPFCEEDPTGTGSAYSISKLESERLVKSAGSYWCIARLATVYGEGDRANFSRLARALKRGMFVVPGPGSARKSVLPVWRAAELLGSLAMRSSCDGIVLNLAAPVAPTLEEICQGFVRACGFRPPRHFPLFPLRVLARLGDGVAALDCRLPRPSDVLAKLTTDTVVDVRRMHALFPGMPWESFESMLLGAAHWYNSP